MCPCKYGRIGAFITVFCLFWTTAFGGLALVLAQVAAGVPFAVGWAIFGSIGVLLLLYGIGEALSHRDNVEGGSVLWSIGVIALCGYALFHHWKFDANSADFSQAVWWAWIGSNTFNIWLQYRGVGRRRSDAPTVHEALPVTQRTVRRLRLSKQSGNAEWIEATEWRGNDHQSSPAPQFFPAPPPRPVSLFRSIEHGEAPQIGYLDHNGNFIPVQMPDAVPVKRRLR